MLSPNFHVRRPLWSTQKTCEEKAWVLIGQTFVPYREVMWMDPEQLVDLRIGAPCLFLVKNMKRKFHGVIFTNKKVSDPIKISRPWILMSFNFFREENVLAWIAKVVVVYAWGISTQPFWYLENCGGLETGLKKCFSRALLDSCIFIYALYTFYSSDVLVIIPS